MTPSVRSSAKWYATSSAALTTTYAYDALGNRVAETDGLGNTRYTEYDGNRKVAEYDALGNKREFVNDAFGRAIQVKVPKPNNAAGTVTMSMSYDQLDRLTSMTDGLGGTTSYTYDGRGNRIKVTDERGNPFWTLYDGLGRVTITAEKQSGQIVGEVREYDYYNNIVAKTTNEAFSAAGNVLTPVQDGTERVRSFTFGGFG